MVEAPRQLALDLPVEENFDAEDFLVSPCNEQAYAMLEAWPRWPEPVLLLEGPPGSGKSHLAAVWAGRSQALILRRTDLDRPDLLDHVRQHPLVIEDCDRTEAHEHALFHLLNVARESRSSVLLTARTPPGEWGIRTPDLLSRLRLAPHIALAEPDDALLGALLVKFFVERQMVVDTSVVDYVRPRLERSVAAARAFVDALDREGFERKRRITRALAADVLRRTEAAQGTADPQLPL
jgi:chromosomal replication initiation ATPase DnaA